MFQNEVETPDGRRVGTARRGRKLRGVPASVRRPAILLAVPGRGRRNSSQRGGSLLPTGGGCCGRGHYATETSSVPFVSGSRRTITSTSPRTTGVHILPSNSSALAYTGSTSQSAVRRRRGRLS